MKDWSENRFDLFDNIRINEGKVKMRFDKGKQIIQGLPP